MYARSEQARLESSTHLLVDGDSTTGLGQDEVEQRNSLERVCDKDSRWCQLTETPQDKTQRAVRTVEGEPREDDVGEGLEEGEGAKDTPVGEPLNVVLGRGGLESSEGEVGGEHNTDKVGKEASSNVEEDENKEEGGGTESSVGLGDLGLALKAGEGRVLGELSSVTRLAHKIFF